MSETKPCIACSEDIKSSAKLCKHCNTRQDDKSFESPEQGDEDFDPVEHWSQYKSKSKGDSSNVIGKIIIGALIVTPIILAGLYFFSFGQFVNFNFTQSNESGAGDTNSQPQQVTYEPHERYYNLTAVDGAEFMRFAQDALNYYDPSGKWEEDTFESSSPLVVGVLLDTYSAYPAGCAIWFFDSYDDLYVAIGEGSINFFSEAWWNWEDKSGAAFLAIGNSYQDDCFQNLEDALQVEAYP
jgi:hypothetical protein